MSRDREQPNSHDLIETHLKRDQGFDALAEVTLLLKAVKKGDYQTVKTLLEEGVDPYVINNRAIAQRHRLNLIKNFFGFGKNKKEPSQNNKGYFKYLAEQYTLFQNYNKIIAILPPTHSQAWLIKRIQTIHPSLEPEGVCFGVANMAMQALLVGDLRTYHRRLEAISRVPQNQFAQKVEEIKNKKINAYRRAKEKYNQLKERGEPADLDKLIKAIIRSEWNQQDYYLRDLDAFFDGVKLYQQSELNPLYAKETNPGQLRAAQETVNLISPVPIINIDNFSAIYTQQELGNHFLRLKMHLVENNFAYAIALRLSNHGHAITVGFDRTVNQWYLIDANRRPIVQMYMNEMLLAEKVIESLFSKDNAIIATNVFVAEKDQAVVRMALSQWKSEEDWEKVHTVNTERARMQDARGKRWLDVTYAGGDASVTKQLIEVMDADTQNNKTVLPSDKFLRIWKGIASGYSLLVAAAIIITVAVVFASGGIGLGVLVGVIAATTAFAALSIGLSHYFENSAKKSYREHEVTMVPNLPHIEPQSRNNEPNKSFKASSPINDAAFFKKEGFSVKEQKEEQQVISPRKILK